MPPVEREAWLRLIRAPGIGPVAARGLVEAFGDAASALNAGPAAWRASGLDARQCEGLSQTGAEAIAADLCWLETDRRHLVTCKDPAYPAALRQAMPAPVALFCQGDIGLLGLPQFAVVGARSPSPQGLDNARAFAGELARRGLVITSGLALGVDGAAHQGALDAEGGTVAVCATGLDRIYPARHKALAHRIAERGLLVSEFPTGVEPLAENFPRRNRIISGLSLGVLVVEAARESGSLITARYAMEQGREVFAIPGSIHNPVARGCHQLIRQGAKLTETVDDILEEIAPQFSAALRAALPREPAASPPPASGPGQQVLQILGDQPRTLDELVEKTGLPVGQLNALLLDLELQGLAASGPGGRYMRR